jgi:hypothetical protein
MPTAPRPLLRSRSSNATRMAAARSARPIRSRPRRAPTDRRAAHRRQERRTNTRGELSAGAAEHREGAQTLTRKEFGLGLAVPLLTLPRMGHPSTVMLDGNHQPEGGSGRHEARAGSIARRQATARTPETHTRSTMYLAEPLLRRRPELKREFVLRDLHDRRRPLVPIAAALAESSPKFQAAWRSCNESAPQFRRRSLGFIARPSSTLPSWLRPDLAAYTSPSTAMPATASRAMPIR